jgi:hypothetical protein
MTYFAVVWKNKKISLEELKYAKIYDEFDINDILIWFECDDTELLNQLWWIIKWWEILEEEELADEFQDKKILGTKNKNFWLKLKRDFNVKRFKEVDILKTDKEVKNKWIEIIELWDKYWVVRWYQNIWLYEKLDFEKPSRSMQMWMMPAKFTHIMANIWLSRCYNKDDLTIYDPFAGSGTTWFIANYLGYDFIWSDLNIKHLQENQKRWEWQKEWKNKSFTIFQHDISNDIPEENLKWNILIVSEWWLWPIVKSISTPQEIAKYQNEVWTLYKKFITTISKTKKNHHTKAVFTIPYYMNQNNFLEQEIKSRSSTFDWKFLSIDEIYAREWQKVGRKIIILE